MLFAFDEMCFFCIHFLVYNEEDNDLYVHHDILLDTFPLALEWLNFDTESDDKLGTPPEETYAACLANHISRDLN